MLLVEGGVRLFTVVCLNTSAYRVKGCVMMIHRFTAHPGRHKPMQEDCQTIRRKNEENDRET